MHDQLPVPQRAILVDLFRDPEFPDSGGATYSDRCRAAYTQLRWLAGRGMSARALLGDRSLAIGLAGMAAVVNPALSMLVATHHFLGAGTIAEFGAGQPGLDRWLVDLDASGPVFTFLITELGYGNSHAALRTEAVHDPATHELVVHTPDIRAQKFMAANGLPGVAKTGVIAARLFTGGVDRGVFPVVVPLRDEHRVLPGVAIRALPESPYSPMDYSVIAFDHVRVPIDALLADRAAIAPDGGFHDPLGGRDERERRSLRIRESAWIAFCAQLMSAGQAGITIALRYAHHRMTRTLDAGARPVIELRVQQRALFGALATVYGMSLLVGRAVGAWLAPGDGDWAGGAAFNRSLGLTRAVAARDIERVLATCSWRSGAQGVFACNRIAEYQGLAHILNPAAGDGQLVAMAAARSMAAGDNYRPPALPSQPVSGDALDPGFWLHLARVRERAAHADLVAGLGEGSGRSEVERWNDCFLLGQELVDAHAHRLVLESFTAACARLPESPLSLLCTLHAIEHTQHTLAWHLAEGTLTAEIVRSVPRVLNTLCERLAPHALALVDAFELPSDLLRAPIEQADYTEFFACSRPG